MSDIEDIDIEDPCVFEDINETLRQMKENNKGMRKILEDIMKTKEKEKNEKKLIKEYLNNSNKLYLLKLEVQTKTEKQKFLKKKIEEVKQLRVLDELKDYLNW